MKLSHVLVACNEKTHYLDFWPIVKKAWLEVANLPCTMVYVGEELPAHLQGDIAVHWFKPIPGWPTATQAQCIRLLYPALLDFNGAVMISDMDMIPLQSDWFIKGFQQFREDQFVSLRGIDEEAKQIYMCYVGATPKVWGEMFGISCEQDIRDRLTDWSANYFSTGKTPHFTPDGREYYLGWATDQMELYKHVTGCRPERIGLIPLTTDFPRLCRDRPSEWLNLSPDFKRALRGGAYIDFHMPAFQEYENQIEMIVMGCTYGKSSQM